MKAFKVALCSILLFSLSVSDICEAIEMPKQVVGRHAPDVLNGEQAAEIECLAKNIYFEAGNQGTKGKFAVAFVTLNRAKSGMFPSNVCDVVYQAKYTRSKQDRSKWVPIKNTCNFSWHCDPSKGEITEPKTWEDSFRVAYYLYFYRNTVYDITQGALFYHANYVKPSWGKTMEKTVVVQDHIFYKLRS